MSLGNNLRYLRLSRNMTLKEVSEFVGVGISQINAYEKGVSFPKYDGLLKLIELFEVTANDLIHRDLAKDGPEDKNAPAPTIDINQVISMYQDKVRELTEQVGDSMNKEQLQALLADLEKIDPERVKYIKEKYKL